MSNAENMRGPGATPTQLALSASVHTRSRAAQNQLSGYSAAFAGAPGARLEAP